MWKTTPSWWFKLSIQIVHLTLTGFVWWSSTWLRGSMDTFGVLLEWFWLSYTFNTILSVSMWVSAGSSMSSQLRNSLSRLKCVFFNMFLPCNTTTVVCGGNWPPFGSFQLFQIWFKISGQFLIYEIENLHTVVCAILASL